MNKLEAMHTFVKIVECGSLTGAADVLDTSSPTVVRTLASLEEYLGIRLLNRTTRKITLTDEGRLYLERCRNILRDIDDAENELHAKQELATGKLSVTAPVMFGSIILKPIINEFLRMNQQLSIDFLLIDRNIHLIEEGVDVAIRIGPLQDSSMIAKQVGHVRRVVCATPVFLDSQEPILNPKDLSNVPCINFSGLNQGSNWQFYENNKIHTIAITGPLTCNQGTVALDAVCAGMGVGNFLSYQIKDQLVSGELITILEEYEPTPLPIHIVYSHKKLLSSRIRIFVDWLSQELRKTLEIM